MYNAISLRRGFINWGEGGYDICAGYEILREGAIPIMNT